MTRLLHNSYGLEPQPFDSLSSSWNTGYADLSDEGYWLGDRDPTGILMFYDSVYSQTDITNRLRQVLLDVSPLIQLVTFEVLPVVYLQANDPQVLFYEP